MPTNCISESSQSAENKSMLKENFEKPIQGEIELYGLQTHEESKILNGPGTP